MNRARAFEHYWAEFERPGRPAAESLPPAPDLAGAVATATALHEYGQALPAMDLDTAWESLTALLEMEVMPDGVPARPNAAEPPLAEAGPNVILLRPRLRWTVRVAAAAVAAMLALATVSLRAGPGSALYPVRLTVERAALAISPRDGDIHLRVAEARLGDLLDALRRGPFQAAPGLARSLVVNRASAGRAGADLSDLDLRIALEVPPALRAASSAIAASVRTILGDLLPPEEPGSAGVWSSGPGRAGGPRGHGHGSSEDRGENPFGHGSSEEHRNDGDHRKNGQGEDRGSSSQGSGSHGSNKGEPPGPSGPKQGRG